MRLAKPEMVTQFRVLEWTTADHLRHASFLALREDKDPLSVVKEMAEPEAIGRLPNERPLTLSDLRHSTYVTDDELLRSDRVNRGDNYRTQLYK